MEERRVDDVGVADDPADVGSRPVDLARIDPVDVLHRPGERDRVAAVVADDALRLAGRPGGVEDVERVGCFDGDAGCGLGPRDRVAPVEIAAGDELGLEHRPLQHDAAFGLGFDLFDRGVE